MLRELKKWRLQEGGGGESGGIERRRVTGVGDERTGSDANVYDEKLRQISQHCVITKEIEQRVKNRFERGGDPGWKDTEAEGSDLPPPLPPRYPDAHFIDSTSGLLFDKRH